MSAEQIEQFVYALKIYLSITWEDPADDARLAEIVRAGAAYLNQKNGAPADYQTPGLPRTILMEYARYARDNALDVFENNYQSMILSMQHDSLVEQFKAAQEAQSK